MIAHWSPRNWLSRGFIDIWVLPNRGVPLFTIGCPIKNARLWGPGWLGKASFLSWNYSWNVQVTNAGRKYSILWVEAVCDDEEAGKRWLDIHPNHANVFFLMFFLQILIFPYNMCVSTTTNDSRCLQFFLRVDPWLSSTKDVKSLRSKQLGSRCSSFTWSESTLDLTVCQLIDCAVWAGMTSM